LAGHLAQPVPSPKLIAEPQDGGAVKHASQRARLQRWGLPSSALLAALLGVAIGAEMSSS
jgi:hypothetical protein